MSPSIGFALSKTFARVAIQCKSNMESCDYAANTDGNVLPLFALTPLRFYLHPARTFVKTLVKDIHQSTEIDPVLVSMLQADTESPLNLLCKHHKLLYYSPRRNRTS